MNKLFTLFLFVAATFSVQAQTANAVIFSENGEKFTAYLNGEPQNQTATSNVKVTGLTSEFYQLRVDFADAALADFSMNQFAVQPGTETTYMIKKNKKGEFVCRFQGQVPIQGTASSSSSGVNSDVKQYAVVDDQQSEQGEEMESPKENMSINSTVTGPGSGVTQTVTTTTTTRPSSSGENISMKVNVDGMNMGIDMNVSGMDMEDETIVEEKTTVVEKTSTPSRPAPTREVSGPCARSMSATEFNNAKSSIGSKGFDDSRLTVAKQMTKSNCLTAAQVKEVMGLLSFEESKLDFAKFAYDYCFDQKNYYVVNDAFGFSGSIDELNEYIGSK